MISHLDLDEYENTFICVDGECQEEQKVFTSGQQVMKHRLHKDVRYLNEVRSDMEINAKIVDKFMLDHDLIQQLTYVDKQKKDFIMNSHIDLYHFLDQIKSKLSDNFIEIQRIKDILHFIRADQMDELKQIKGNLSFLQKIKKLPELSERLKKPFQKAKQDIKDFMMKVDELLEVQNQQPNKKLVQMKSLDLDQISKSDNFDRVNFSIKVKNHSQHQEVKKGQAEYDYINGEAHKGQHKSDKKNVQGVIIHANGDRYQGDTYNGTKHGQGEYLHTSGEIYKGNYVNGKKHGYGEYYHTFGQVYKGQYKNNLQNGLGETIFAEGSTYKGNYVDGKINGYGVYHWINGNSYKGYWLNNLRNGHGLTKFANGDRYEGSYIDGEQDGYGAYFHTSGKVQRGQYKHGKMI